MDNSSIEEVKNALAANERTGGTQTIVFRGAVIMAPVRAIRSAIDDLRSTDRIAMMASVNEEIDAAWPLIKAQKASQETAMHCMQDIAIWFANEVIEGRATLG